MNMLNNSVPALYDDYSSIALLTYTFLELSGSHCGSDDHVTQLGNYLLLLNNTFSRYDRRNPDPISIIGIYSRTSQSGIRIGDLVTQVSSRLDPLAFNFRQCSSHIARVGEESLALRGYGVMLSSMILAPNIGSVIFDMGAYNAYRHVSVMLSELNGWKASACYRSTRNCSLVIHPSMKKIYCDV